MKFIGHVSVAVIASSPIIYWRGALPASMQAPELSAFDLLWWTALFGVLPDVDVLLSRYTAIKHRGMTTHSLYSVLAATAVLLIAWLGAGVQLLFLNALTVALALLGLCCHLLCDSLTKTGIPLLKAKPKWTFPYVGGYAAFDSYWLNAIPLFIAGYIVHAAFGFDPGVLRKLGR